MNATLEEEKAIAARWLAGDKTAVRDAMVAFGPLVRGIVFRYLKNNEDTEEISNDAFRNADRAIASFRGGCRLSTWISQIARNLALNRYLHRKRRGYGAGVDLDSDLADGRKVSDLIPCANPGPSELVDAAEMLSRITLAMESLKEPHREVLRLRYVRRLPYGEIADALGLNFGTVKSRIARARDELKARLSEGSSGEIRLRRRRV